MDPSSESDLTTSEVLDFNELPSKSEESLWKSQHFEYFKNLSQLDLFYKPSPNYFDTQSDLSPSMRTILLNWLLEVSEFFHLKRETYYLALSTLDRVLSSIRVTQSDLQLIGITCLCLSVKREEIENYPIEDFAKTTADTFTVSQIKQKESELLPLLKWQLCPATYFNWLNALMQEWDAFISAVFVDTISQVADTEKLAKMLVTFKKKDLQSFFRFTHCVEMLDLCTMDFAVTAFRPAKLVAAIFYVSVFREFTLSQFELFPPIEEMPELQDHASLVDALLVKFFAGTVEVFSVEELAAEIRFVNVFQDFRFSDDSVRFGLAERYNNYEEFLAFQTYNQRYIEYLTG